MILGSTLVSKDRKTLTTTLYGKDTQGRKSATSRARPPVEPPAEQGPLQFRRCPASPPR